MIRQLIEFYDITEKGDINTRREAKILSYPTQELKFAFMLEFCNDVLLRFHAVDKALQEVEIDLKHAHI